MVINYDKDTKMYAGFPKIRKLGATSPGGESTSFVWNGRMMRTELHTDNREADADGRAWVCIRDRETGEIISEFGEGCYFHSLYKEDDTVYVTACVSDRPGRRAGSTIRMFESKDLINWTSRDLFTNPGWTYFNTSLTKGPDGYVLLMEAKDPPEHVGVHFTFFFATSPDLYNWTLMDYNKCFSKDHYMGGPWMHYSRGYYYVFAVTELLYLRYTNYLYRTKDFETWEVGVYNPILSPSEEDRKLSPMARGFTPEEIEELKSVMIISSSDIDLCDWPEENKVLINYNLGNQIGGSFHFLAEAEVDGSLADFLESNFY